MQRWWNCTIIQIIVCVGVDRWKRISEVSGGERPTRAAPSRRLFLALNAPYLLRYLLQAQAQYFLTRLDTKFRTKCTLVVRVNVVTDRDPGQPLAAFPQPKIVENSKFIKLRLFQ